MRRNDVQQQDIPDKKNASGISGSVCCPTWIRTKTNRTKICRTTIILSGKIPAFQQDHQIWLSPKGVQKYGVFKNVPNEFCFPIQLFSAFCINGFGILFSLQFFDEIECIRNHITHNGDQRSRPRVSIGIENSLFFVMNRNSWI